MSFATLADFQATSKRIAKGKKVAHTLTHGGEVLGTRESTRQYGVVVVAVQDANTVEGLKAHYENMRAADLRNWEGYSRLEAEGKPFKYMFPGQKSYMVTLRRDGQNAVTRCGAGPDSIRKHWADRLADTIEYVDMPRIVGWSRDEKTGAAMGKDYADRGWNVLLVPVV